MIDEPDIVYLPIMDYVPEEFRSGLKTKKVSINKLRQAKALDDIKKEIANLN
jgi:hypothetical protein